MRRGGSLEGGLCRVSRMIKFYEVQFEEGGSLEGSFCFCFCALTIAFHEELFDEGGSLELGFCCFSRALSHFMKSRLTWVMSECKWALCVFACVRCECERVGSNVFLLDCFSCWYVL